MLFKKDGKCEAQRAESMKKGVKSGNGPGGVGSGKDTIKSTHQFLLELPHVQFSSTIDQG
jgi:hypothetical protein